jgi:two-component system, NtrC family, sensor kinase
MAEILVVDDSLTVRMDLCSALDAAGLSALGCASAAQARAALAQGSFALVILDLRLPDADGLEFLSELKGSPATAALPVMLLSSEAEVRDRVRGLQTGADEYLGKPYDLSYVVARAGELVRRRAPPRNASERVLVIDDSATCLENLKAALEARGYTVATAVTGEDGLRAVIDLRPAAVIVDGMLPGIDGPTVIRRIKLDAALRRTSCILLTGSNERADELRALDAGADACVRKDDGTEVILARLAAVMRSAWGTAGGNAAPSAFGPKKILAIDDSPTYLHELAAQLQAETYDVVLAHCGEEALELLAIQAVDCILLDLVMPGLSGEETCRRIKAVPEWRGIPLILLTAQEGRDAMIQGINAGADDYIIKSSDFDVLKARVRAQLRRKQLEDENQRTGEELLLKQVEAANAARELAETRAAFLANLEGKNAELAAANRALERSNSELEHFAYVASHDLQEPLRTVASFVQLLQMRYQGKLDRTADEYIQFAVGGAVRMKQLINDLLAYSRVGRGKPIGPTDSEQTLKYVLTDLSLRIEEYGARVTHDPLPVVLADETQLGQVFQNLLDNALKFRGSRAPEIHISAQRQRDEWLFSVRDNGIGIDHQYWERVFTVFQRLHTQAEYPGTGIGLSICRRILERFGHSIWVESQPGGGATFYFTLTDSGASETPRAGSLEETSPRADPAPAGSG